MKKFPSLCLSVSALSLFAVSLSAAVFDSFESYPTGTLNGSNGGEGWTDAWSSSLNSAQVAELSLSYSSGDINISDGDQVMQQGLSASTDNTANQTNRSFDAYSAGSDTLYMSFLIQSPTLEGNDYFSVWLNQDQDFGVIIRNGDIRSVAPNQSEKSSGVTLTNNQTFLLIVKVSSSGTTAGTFFDQNEIYINPTSLTEPLSPSISSTTDSSTISSIDTFGVRYALFEANTDVAYVDRVTISDNWADAVSPIPEMNHSALFLSLVPISWLLISRRTKK
ncbi:hypothetical protein [Puniceicoccus vermicola]|uniref:PEP-CTERM sorting domain-containing protein n=1 Tax=Puniceicoccus vermicola TaxID=388746 RepID=A0A7X1AYZ8_9BACT|nr:hypothetical protein [Puniceicoccus vermicola]MBC2602562.1 hypothetical protein [Puniceicoccus vermicola]